VRRDRSSAPDLALAPLPGQPARRGPHPAVLLALFCASGFAALV
jgi:hypothetical protein